MEYKYSVGCYGCGHRESLRPLQKGIVKCTLCGTAHKVISDTKGFILLIKSDMTKTRFIRLGS